MRVTHIKIKVPFFCVEASRKSRFEKRVRWFLDLSLKTGDDSGW
jgi:hypothetical protein